MSKDIGESYLEADEYREQWMTATSEAMEWKRKYRRKGVWPKQTNILSYFTSIILNKLF